jgi:putative transposase
LQVEEPQIQQKEKEIKEQRVVGIDLGINHFIVDSNGFAIENPRIIDKQLKRIRVLYRKLSRKKKNSKNFEKEKLKIEKLHLKIKNIRLDFLHKLSKYYVENYDVIYVEDLNVKNMLKGKHKEKLHMHINDASWATFKQLLSYKAERAGKRVVAVNAENTTQRCSNCGHINKRKMQLKDRIFVCEECGFVADRDYNAAMNILKSGLGQPGEPVNTYDHQRGGRFEGAPLLCEISAKEVITGQELSMRQEAPSVRVG